MKLSVAQTRPVKGDIAANLRAHERLVKLAAVQAADIIVFPELSITGYEPGLAGALATTADDSRFNTLQQLADDNAITICAGMPVKGDDGVMIGLLIFQPHAARQVYCKQYLHADELPYFIPGKGQCFLHNGSYKIGLAICYELSVPGHADNLFANGANVYIASVAKSATGMQNASTRLAEIASTHHVPALISNCAGRCNNFDSYGNSAAWDADSNLLTQLDDNHEGLVIYDTATGTGTMKIY